MASKDQSNLELREEAQSAATSSARLHDLLRLDPTLAPTIASNPSAPPALLNELALKHPAEVLANSVLPLRGLEVGGVYSEFSLSALVSLCLACEPEQHADLLEESRRRLIAGLAELVVQEEVSLSCVWLFERHFTVHPNDCDYLIDEPIEFKLVVRAFMEGQGAITLHDIPDFCEASLTFPSPEKAELVKFLQAIRSSRLDFFISEDDIVREDGGGADFSLEATNLPAILSLEGCTIYKDDLPILRFTHNYGSDDDHLDFDDGCLSIPAGDMEEIDLEFEIAMGELNTLVSLEFMPDGITPCDWPTRLATLLIP